MKPHTKMVYIVLTLEEAQAYCSCAGQMIEHGDIDDFNPEAAPAASGAKGNGEQRCLWKMLSLAEHVFAWDDLEFTCRLRAYEYHADFELFEQMSLPGEKPTEYTRRGANFTGDTVTDLDKAELFADGGVKWDGCANFMFNQDSQGSPTNLHTCSRKALMNVGLVLARVWDEAAKLVPKTDCVPGED